MPSNKRKRETRTLAATAGLKYTSALRRTAPPSPPQGALTMHSPFTRCIYCGGDTNPSKEHVLQRSLGGDLTARIACVACNTKLSEIDVALAERSFVTLHRVGFAPTARMPVKLGGDTYLLDEQQSVWQECRVVNGMRAELYPQIHLVGDQLMVVGGNHEELAELFSLIERRRTDGTLARTYVKVGPADKATTTRIVGHKMGPTVDHGKQDAFVRAASPEAGEKFLLGLAKAWPEFMAKVNGASFQQGVIEGAHVNVNVRMRLDDTYRAVAKIAFNLFAQRFGVDEALRREFDPIREYVTGKTIVHSPDRGPDEIAFDRRFVTMLQTGGPPLTPTGDHAVALCTSSSALLAVVTLYGEFTFIVRLGPVPGGKPVFELHEFTADRTGNKAVPCDETMRRLSRWLSTLRKS
jgi:hypothetical protein